MTSGDVGTSSDRWPSGQAITAPLVLVLLVVVVADLFVLVLLFVVVAATLLFVLLQVVVAASFFFVIVSPSAARVAGS